MFSREHTNIFVPFSDLGWGIAGVFIVLVVLLILVIGTPKEEDSGIKPGSLMVNTIWVNGSSDIDTWVSDPFGEVIGYSRKNAAGALWSLLKDDTGLTSDFDKKNEEWLFTVGIAPGEYIINIHAYRITNDPLPMPVRVIVQLFLPSGGVKTLYNIHTELLFNCQERTVVRFTLDAEGNKTSESYLQKNLRSSNTCSRGGFGSNNEGRM